MQLKRWIQPRHCDPYRKPWKMIVNLTIFRHGEKLPRENFKDHGFTPCFYISDSSTSILKNGRKCRTLMEKRIVPLCLWHREVLKPYKICQKLTKWKFGPLAKFYLELHALSFSPECTEKLLLNKMSRADFSIRPFGVMVEIWFNKEEVGRSNPTSSHFYIKFYFFIKKLGGWAHLGRLAPVPSSATYAVSRFDEMEGSYPKGQPSSM